MSNMFSIKQVKSQSVSRMKENRAFYFSRRSILCPKGNNSTYSNVKIKKTSWSFGTDYQESLDINGQLIFITNILNDKKQELQKIKKSYNVNYQISIVIKIENNQSPAIYLESDIIRLADEIQAEFDVDLYVIS